MLSASDSKSHPQATRVAWRRNILQVAVSALGAFIGFVGYRLSPLTGGESKKIFDRLSVMTNWRLTAALLLFVGLAFVIYMVQYVFNNKYNAVTKILFSAAGFILLYELSILADTAFP